MTADRALCKRLCIVTHVCRKNDGQGRVNYEIVKAALAAGWQVTILASELAPDLAVEPHLVWVKISASKLPSNLLKYQIFAWKTAKWLRLHNKQFDVIHVNGFITWEAAHINTVHFVHSGWLASDHYPYRRLSSPGHVYQKLFTSINARLEKRAFQQAQTTVAVSSRIATEIADTGISASKIKVILNGVDLSEFQPGPGAREKFGLPTNSPMALFAGDIRTPRKNLETVLRALVIAKNCQLAVAGRLEGSPYPEMTHALGISSRVHFLGMVKNMPELMRCADMFVFPSRYEPMGLVVLEALASGTPVITAKSVGASDIVGEGGRVLGNSEDVETLASWIAGLATQTVLRETMGKHARRIAEWHSWQIMCEKYLTLYDLHLSQPLGCNGEINTSLN